MFSPTTPRKRPRYNNNNKVPTETVDMVGYITWVNPKISKSEKSSFFDLYLGLEESEVRIVSFNTDIHSQLMKRMKKGIIFFKLSKSNADWIYSDTHHSSFNDKDPPFVFVNQYNVVSTPLKEAIEEKPLYSRVSMDIKVIQIKDEGISKEGLPFQSVRIIDNSIKEPRMLTLFDKLVTKVAVQSSYTLSYVSIQLFGGQRVFKTTERSTITTMKKDTIKCPKQDAAEELIGTVITVNLKSVEAKLCCPQCENPVNSSGGISIFCHFCSEAVSRSRLLKMGVLQFKVLEDNCRLPRALECSHLNIEKFLNFSLSDTDRFFSMFMDSKLVIKHLKGEVILLKHFEKDQNSTSAPTGGNSKKT
ncbi:uncharacterized protein [Clytia hemisphaerica]|uniref:Uncharacterized protein n=1 Tax=Clytia hemisphaerica TaxID=252671 RepID=A0A7M5WV38_9CNID